MRRRQPELSNLLVIILGENSLVLLFGLCVLFWFELVASDSWALACLLWQRGLVVPLPRPQTRILSSVWCSCDKVREQIDLD
jgi:hypothetical protein